MTSITLTEEHKSKLLEMCKVLFPEYSWDITANLLDLDANDPNKFWNTITYCKYGKSVDKFSETIHWFEFCTIHIMEKLQRNGGGKEFSDYIHICFRYTFPQYDTWSAKIHPVDYLYDEFQKLK